MNEQKQSKFIIDVSAPAKWPNRSTTRFFSYDSHTAEIVIQAEKDGELIDQTLVDTVDIYFESVNMEYRPIDGLKWNDTMDISADGLYSYVLPDDFLNYEGLVAFDVYINYKNGDKADSSNRIIFEQRVSAIDRVAGAVELVYIKDMETAKREIIEQATEITENFLREWNAFEAGSTAKMQELEQRIDEQTEIFNNADVYNKAEIEDKLEPFALQTDIAEVSAKLAETAKQSDLDFVKNSVNDVPFQSSMYPKISSLTKKVAFPAGFTWTSAPINIYKNDKGKITTDFDAADHKPDTTGTQTYYVSLSGSNSNDGLSEATPFRRVSDALIKADCGEIIVSGGFYPRGQAWSGFSPARNMIIRAKTGEKVIFSASDALTWTLSAGYTKVYQASRTTVNDVFDARFVNRFGDYAELTKVNSIAEVESTQGSWYTDGTIIYVHTYNGRPADSYIRAYLNTNNAIITIGNHFYIEGIDFEGGNSNIRIYGTDPAMKVVMKDCRFKYTKLLNCVSAYGAEVYMQDCEASYGNQDGLNYHIKNGVPCKVIEVNCRSHRNGRDGANQNNGSTNHDGGKTIRVNGEYFENSGPNVIDVNEGSESWNLGVVAHESRAESGISNSDFKNSNVGKGLMWLDSCISYGSDYSVVTAGLNSETYITNNILNGDVSNDPDTALEYFETQYVPVSEYTDVLT